MSGRDRSRERSPADKGKPAKKTKDDKTDTDPQEPSTSQPRGSSTPKKAGSDAPSTRSSTRISSRASSKREKEPLASKPKKGKAKSKETSKGASTVKRLATGLLSLLGVGDSDGSPPKKGGSSKGSKPFIGPLLPEGYEPYTKEELDRMAEYYRQNSFLNRTVRVVEYIPFGPGASVTIPWATPPTTTGPTYSTAQSSPITLASTIARYPNLSALAVAQSKATSTELAYPHLAAIGKSQFKASPSTDEEYPNLAAIAKSQSKASPPTDEAYLNLPAMAMAQSEASLAEEAAYLDFGALALSLYETATITEDLYPKLSSIARSLSKTAASHVRAPVASPFVQPDGAEPSTSGLQRPIVREDSSSDFSPDVPSTPVHRLPPARPPPPPPENETEEERLKRPRRKGEPKR